ncbi:MAG: cupin domain-containing protein [Gammaproteobacteria bacterium]|nr:cupin domain-containing protein [Gammaproteobacteria bacterium]MCP5201704.1 cupin domain-containing protein [Gammaproteobacteria bacterium]
MFVKSLSACPPLVANDGCTLREVLHPKNDPIALPYSLAVAEVAVGEQSYRHRLAQDEVYYVLAGRGLMHVDGETRELGPGDAVFIAGGKVQWIENAGAETLRFVALVSPPWRAEDDERL